MLRKTRRKTQTQTQTHEHTKSSPRISKAPLTSNRHDPRLQRTR